MERGTGEKRQRRRGMSDIDAVKSLVFFLMCGCVLVIKY